MTRTTRTTAPTGVGGCPAHRHAQPNPPLACRTIVHLCAQALLVIAAVAPALLRQQAYQLVQEADLMAAKAELELPEAEKAAQHAETARSALTQVMDGCRHGSQLLLLLQGMGAEGAGTQRQSRRAVQGYWSRRSNCC